LKKIALITGASSGIGSSIAKLFAKNGITVCLGARSTNKLKKLVEEINSFGGDSYSYYLDLLDDNSVNKFINNVNTIGEVDILINNSGLGKFDKIETASLKDWDEMMNVNLRGSFIMSKAFIPKMKQNNSGNIVFINSVAGKHGYPYSAGYVASKFGLRGLADSLRNELRSYNIKVTSIYPGAVDSYFWENVKADFPRDEMMNIDEIAETALFSIQKLGVGVLEDIVIRRTKGDF
jgi:short-subunit dehydrogenase